MIGEFSLSRLTPDLMRQLMSELTAAGYAPETTAKTMRWVRLTLTKPFGTGSSSPRQPRGYAFPNPGEPRCDSSIL